MEVIDPIRSQRLAGGTQLYAEVADASQPAAARRAAMELARRGGVDEEVCGAIALVVTELATNLVKHARGGALFMRLLEPDEGGGFEVLSVDRGPGIGDLAQALRDGFSTAGSAGTGLGAVVRAAADVDVFSQPAKGTVLVARVGRQPNALAPQAVGVIHRAMPGEPVCGDEWMVCHRSDGWLCAVADGLGHGELAAHAASSVIGSIQLAPEEWTPGQLLEAAHEAAKPTRGAAGAVALFDESSGHVRFAGIGNISASVVEARQRRQLVSHNGILGHHYRKMTEFSQPWLKESILVVHSDGLSAQWDLSQYPGLRGRDASVIAGVLFRDFARGRDDTTVVVLRDGARGRARFTGRPTEQRPTPE